MRLHASDLRGVIFLSDPTPKGDFLLIKDVLQHLSNRGVQVFIETILPRFRYAIMTNDVHKYEEWRRLGVFTSTRELVLGKLLVNLLENSFTIDYVLSKLRPLMYDGGASSSRSNSVGTTSNELRSPRSPALILSAAI